MKTVSALQLLGPIPAVPEMGLEPLTVHGMFAGVPPTSWLSSLFSAPKLYKETA